MATHIRTISADDLALYSRVPIAFRVESVLQVELVGGGLGGVLLREERVDAPYLKDYDAYEGGPERWPVAFDVRNWSFFLAMEGDRPIGGATVAWNTAGVRMLAGRSDLAVLWDIRVRPDLRRRGVGTMLLRRAAGWSREHGCRQLKIETQNVNVPACRFYAGQGCRLGAIDRYGYAGHPQVGHEVMLIWHLHL